MANLVVVLLLLVLTRVMFNVGHLPTPPSVLVSEMTSLPMVTDDFAAGCT
jgi:hypothetical protein